MDRLSPLDILLGFTLIASLVVGTLVTDLAGTILKFLSSDLSVGITFYAARLCFTFSVRFLPIIKQI
ncbi:MAG: hypothetical protein DMF05_09850 [Verrucomicrobia bacterium]|nr:MAG: hypothetical protein DMF05_09850 [Verrucomicrobiota bacterium]